MQLSEKLPAIIREAITNVKINGNELTCRVTIKQTKFIANESEWYLNTIHDLVLIIEKPDHLVVKDIELIDYSIDNVEKNQEEHFKPYLNKAFQLALNRIGLLVSALAVE
jgi:hypothetical protein